MKKRTVNALLTAMAILCLYAGIAYGMSSTNYQMRIDVLSGGGGAADSTNYDLDSALGQFSAIGVSVSVHYVNHAGFWSAIPEPEPYIPVYVSLNSGCDNKVPCYSALQTAINSSESFSVINVTDETYTGNIVFSSPKFFTLCGGWDLTFASSTSDTVIQGSMTISNGKVIVEYVMVR